MVNVEVLFYPKDKPVFHHKFMLPEGSTVLEALNVSGVLKEYPEVNRLTFGIFSKSALPETILQDGDRVEVYQPLQVTPKDKRRALTRKKIF